MGKVNPITIAAYATIGSGTQFSCTAGPNQFSVTVGDVDSDAENTTHLCLEIEDPRAVLLELIKHFKHGLETLVAFERGELDQPVTWSISDLSRLPMTPAGDTNPQEVTRPHSQDADGASG